MIWKTIRLELARTRDFPAGSASRAYLLRLPIDESGAIDEHAVRKNPAHAVVRRFWPSEPDVIGHVVPANGGWAFSYDRGEAHDGAIFHVDARPLRVGAEVEVTETDGRSLPYRVASLRQPH